MPPWTGFLLGLLCPGLAAWVLRLADLENGGGGR